VRRSPGRRRAGLPTKARHWPRCTSLRTRFGSRPRPSGSSGYDISNIQGAFTVGSMVVFEEGRPRSGEYRRFRVRTVKGPNDFASHQEVLRRRFARSLAAEEGSAEELRWRMPDLVVIGPAARARSAPRARSWTRWACSTCRWWALPRSAKSCSSPASRTRSCCRRHRRRSTWSATARRGAPICDHLPPKAARAGTDEVGVRRDARRRPCSEAGAATGLRSARQLKQASIDEIAAVPGISRQLAERIIPTWMRSRLRARAHWYPWLVRSRKS